MQDLGCLCSTTTCRPPDLGAEALRAVLRASWTSAMQDDGYGLPRTLLLKLFGKWLKGFSIVLCSVAQNGKIGLLHPLCPPVRPQPGGFLDLPKLFRRNCLEIAEGVLDDVR